MPRSPSKTPQRKALGESSGNAVTRLADRSQSSGRSTAIGSPTKAEYRPLDPFTEPVMDQSKTSKENASRRTRSSKYLKSLLDRDKPETAKQSRGSDKRQGHERSKSSNNIYSVFPRPTLSKDAKDKVHVESIGKENKAPPDTPIWAQFATTTVPLNDLTNTDRDSAHHPSQACSPFKQKQHAEDQQTTLLRNPYSRPRPKSECLTEGGAHTSFINTLSGLRHSRRSHELKRSEQYTNDGVVERPDEGRVNATAESIVGKRGSKVMAAVAVFNGKSKQQPPEPCEQPEAQKLDPKAIDSAFESLLDARNVPQITRDKMRALDTNIKRDFLQKDKSCTGSISSNEDLAKKHVRPKLAAVSKSEDGGNSRDSEEGPDQLHEENTPKRSRPRSRTFTFKKDEASPSKKQRSDRSSSHRRSKSGELKKSGSSSSLAASESSNKGWLFGKSQVFSSPQDCIAYLRRRQPAQDVEVGKVHKLKQLLRNETVEWVDTFITDGGMTEIVDLLYRILVIEWREEHEDTLLHETLSCLKALSTTSLALQKLTTIHTRLFPALLGMLFSVEKKGPSEFTTRTLITGLLSTYLSNAPTPDIASKTRTVLSYLRDPSKPEADRPLGFITSMHQPRPYRIWCKEISDVTKEVFWIFLHNMNIIPYPGLTDEDESYVARHYPKPHPPIPTAPYIGGVEWEATTYLTSHLDLLNGLIASLPTMYERNLLRQELRDSGFEKVMGGSLRTCKEKFYSSVHEALSVWIGAAREDGWEYKGVREGALPKTAPSSPQKHISPRKENKQQPPPQLDMPKLDLGECIGKHKAKEGFDGWF